MKQFALFCLVLAASYVAAQSPTSAPRPRVLTAATATAVPSPTAGRAARAEIGQTTFTSLIAIPTPTPTPSPTATPTPTPNPSITPTPTPYPTATPAFALPAPFPTANILAGPGGVAYAPRADGSGMLVVADSNRVSGGYPGNRVLVYTGVNTQMIPAPNAALPVASPSATPLVLDCNVCFGPPPTAIFGQSSLGTFAAGTGPNQLFLPTSVATDGTYLVVADTDNNRVLIWGNISSLPSGPSAAPTPLGPPTLVLGQTGLTSNAANEGKGTVPSASSLRGPQGVWIDPAKRLLVADTLNNRVLIWESLANVVSNGSNNQNADIVLGEPNFTTSTTPNFTQTPLTTTQSLLYDPVSATSDGQNVYVADLGNNRVLIWNIPANGQLTSGQAANIVIGQPSFTTTSSNYVIQTSQASPSATPTFSPTGICPSVGSTTGVINNVDGAALVTDSNNNYYPSLCGATLSFPRFALSDGSTHLFLADGGNDRVLVYNLPQVLSSVNSSGGLAYLTAFPSEVLGQPNDEVDLTTDVNGNPTSTATDTDAIRSPLALAWDPVNSNLYVADPFGLRILVFTPGDVQLPPGSVVNAASLAVFASGFVTLGGTPASGDIVTITINGTAYNYTVGTTNSVADTLANGQIEAGLVTAINTSSTAAVVASSNLAADEVVLTAKTPGPEGNNVTLAASVSSGAGTTATASGVTLTGGDTAGIVAPGTLVAIFGPQPVTPCTTTPSKSSAPPCLVDADVTTLSTAVPLPGTAVTRGTDALQPSSAAKVGGAEVYFDGVRAPIISVCTENSQSAECPAKTQQDPRARIIAQVPFEMGDRSSASVFVRTIQSDGTVTFSSAVGVPIASSNPGIFATKAPSAALLPPVYAFHKYSSAAGFIYVQNFPTVGDIPKVTVNGVTASYAVNSNDTLDSIRDALIELINSNPAMPVAAFRGDGPGDFIEVVAKPNQPNNGNGISLEATNAGTGVGLSASSGVLCCGLTPAGTPIKAGDLVSTAEPATAGEILTVYGTGLGLVNNVVPTNPAPPPNANLLAYEPATGYPYIGNPNNWPNDPVTAAAVANGSSFAVAVLSSGLVTGPLPPQIAAAAGATQGVYRIDLGLDPRIPSSSVMQLSLSQNSNTSNVVTLPVVAQE